nr:DNA (cytosine-5-)-methyltransferase [Candidatus Sigynarchaeota archaeon]
MLDVGSVVSGIGGIEFGLERTRYFRTKWFVESNEFCQNILRKHWPRIPIYGDITTLNFTTLPKVDMLTGGFPCQDISVAGTGKGIKEGTRSGLWFYFAKAIGILRPKYALIENVPMLAKRGLDIVLANLAEAGYDAEWFDLRASDFGAPHRRERIFIVAYDAHGGTDARGRAGEGRKVEQKALGENPECFITDAHDDGFDGAGILLRAGKPRQKDSRNKDGAVADLDLLSRDKIHAGQPDLERRIVADDLRERIQRFVKKKVLRGEGFSWCKDVRRVEDFMGRPNIPQPLFRGTRDGIPDWVDRIRALGNAVVPDCAEFVGEMIMEFDEGRK